MLSTFLVSPAIFHRSSSYTFWHPFEEIISRFFPNIILIYLLIDLFVSGILRYWKHFAKLSFSSKPTSGDITLQEVTREITWDVDKCYESWFHRINSHSTTVCHDKSCIIFPLRDILYVPRYWEEEGESHITCTPIKIGKTFINYLKTMKQGVNMRFWQFNK